MASTGAPPCGASVEASKGGAALDGAAGTAIAMQARHTADGQSHWQQQRKKLKAFDTLSERHFASEEAQEVRREQKTQDEFAARFTADKALK